MKIKAGTIFGALALLLGLAADYFNGRQMEAEVRDTVNEELEKRLNEQNPDK